MIVWLLSTLAICGVIGGIIGYLDELNVTNKGGVWHFLKYLLLGVAASFIVPLFLNTISSTLIKDVLNASSPGSITSLLVVAGFCLIASISSRRFIDRITDKVLEQVNKAVEAADSAQKKADTAVLKAEEAEQKAENADEKVDLFSEPELPEPSQQQPWPRVSSSITTESWNPHAEPLTPDQNQKKVLKAMIDSTFSARAFSGLMNDTGLDEGELTDSLSSLVDSGYMEKKTTQKGFERWFLTDDGRRNARNQDSPNDL
jgi:hypothetical protein